MNNRLLVLIIIVTLVLPGFSGYGRTGLAIRSTGDNLYWDNTSTWIILHSGMTGQVIPQSDDTIYIAHQVFLTNNFELSSGKLVIESTGSLESVNSTLTLSDKASVQCFGNMALLNINLDGQSSFIVTSTGKVTVNGSFQVGDESSFLIHNQGEEYGSLITNGTVLGNITEQVDVEANISRLVSAPVIDAESGVFLNMYLRNYNEEASGWGEYIVPTTEPMNPMQGFEVLSLYDDVRVFTGIPSTGEQRINITSAGDGWNLIGNPYPSSINWSLLGSGNDEGAYPQGISTIYYRDPVSGNYSVFCPGDEPISINSGSPVIRPMEGFFVMTGHSSNISVTNNMRTHSTGIESVAQLPATAISFRVEGNNHSDEAVVRFNPDATANFDMAFDAYKLPGIDAAPEVFFPIEDGSKLALNTLSSVSSGLVVPFQVTTPYYGTTVLHVKGAPEFQFRYPVYLEDVSTGIFVDLRSDSIYSFDSGSDNSNHYFRLHFSSPDGIQEGNSQTIRVISGESSIIIQDSEGRSGNVDVFTIDGKRLYSLENTSLQTLKIPVSSGKVYIIRITTNGRVETSKLFCR
jgi:hypothetical protein